MKTRRAVSLIELMLVMSCCTAVLTMTGVLLHRAMRGQTQSRAVQDIERAALRLSAQFRRDVRLARTAKSDQAGDVFLRIEFADGRNAEYSRVEGTLQRTVFEGGRPVAREEFVFPASSDLVIREDGNPRRVTLTITNNPMIPQAADDKSTFRRSTIPMSLQIEDIIGRDLRFAAVPVVEAQP